MTYVVARTVTVYLSHGKGRRWLTKAAAYRWAAIAMVDERCKCSRGSPYDFNGPCPEPPDTCRYCSRAPEKPKFEHHEGGHYEEIDHSPPDSYRYRLVARLARWLRWMDERSAHRNFEGLCGACGHQKSCPTCVRVEREGRK